MNTPIAFIIFNRPDNTQKVFKAICQAKPSKLLVIADGPRPDRPDDVEKCAATRAIIDRVDWDCEVLKAYSDENLGCGTRLATGISWVFDNVEEAIILEDDCLPHSTFFPFCEEMLARYRDDQRVMSIAGTNIQFGKNRTPYSYYFSRYSMAWGWASWRRAWQYYDFDMKLWPEVRDSNLLTNILVDSKAVKDWTKTLQLTYEGRKNTWDYQWTFAGWMQNGLAIIPDTNLISNIGFIEESTHTTDEESPYSKMLVESMSFPLKHPPFVMPCRDADNFVEETIYDYYSPLIRRLTIKRIKNKFIKSLSSLLSEFRNA